MTVESLYKETWTSQEARDRKVDLEITGKLDECGQWSTRANPVIIEHGNKYRFREHTYVERWWGGDAIVSVTDFCQRSGSH